jgi:hypothetical protein
MNTNQPPPEFNALEKCIGSWAVTLGTNADNVLAMAASILTGMAGPGATLRLPWGNVPLQGLNLLVRDGHGNTSMALETLLSPLRIFNLQVLQSMAGTNRKMLDHLQAGSFATSPARANPNGSTESKALQELRNKIMPERSYEEISSSSDLTPSATVLRLEAMRRPALLLEGARLSELKTLLLGCHRLSALAVLRLAPELDGPDRKKLLVTLTDLMDGIELKIPQGRTIQGIELNHPAKVNAIFRIDGPTWERLHNESPQLLERSLLVADDTPAGSHDIRAAGAAAFNDFYSAAINEIGVTRRDGLFLQVGFGSKDAVMFQKNLLSYNTACEVLTPDVGLAVSNLPMALAWSLLALRRQMTAQHTAHAPTDAQIIEFSFAAAGRLLARHHGYLANIESAATRESMLAIAGRLVFKVRGKGPISERNLVRSFTCQKLSIYRPVIDALVNEQVLEVTPEGLLQLGRRSFEDVQPTLWPPLAVAV